MEQVQLFETADERGCTPMFGAAHRRESAVPLGGMRSLVPPSHSRARRLCHDGFVAWPSRPWYKTWPIC